VLGRTIWMRGAYQPSIGLRGAENVAKNFDVAKSFSHVANRCPCNIQRRMLRACCERVPSMLRTCSEHVANEVTCNIQHRASSLPPPPHVATMLRLCCDHVATCVTCNIQHQEPSLPSFLTQHPTLHVCNIETQHPQHLLNHSETLRCICRNMLE
jgi:hypothetical protein